jgi:hypothetical protein
MMMALTEFGAVAVATSQHWTVGKKLGQGVASAFVSSRINYQ